MERVNEYDFFLGLFSGLQLWSDQARFSCESRLFSHCCLTAYELLESQAEVEELEIRFRIAPDPIHGISDVALDGLNAHQTIAPFEAPLYDAFTLSLSDDDAWRLLNELPGSRQLWERVTKAFIETYKASPRRA